MDTLTTTMTDPATFDLSTFFTNNWGELVLIAMTAIKAVLNLLPSDKPVQVFGYVDQLVNWIVQDHVNQDNDGGE